MHSGCTEGKTFERHKDKKGPWHEAGATRWARQHVGADNRNGQWDGFCALHKGEAQEQSTASAEQGTSTLGAVGTGGLAEKGKGAGAGPRAAARKRARKLASNNTARISTNLGLLAAAHPRAWTPEGVQAIPPPPQCRVQAHTDLEVSEVHEMTTRIAMEYTEGMPRPKADGSLTLGTGRWSGRTEDVIEVGSLPFLRLPRARNRALKRKPAAGWDKASMALALADHVVSGTLVFVVPEVIDCEYKQGFR